MDRRHKTLELDKVLNLVMDCAQNEEAKRMIKSLTPKFNERYVEQELKKADEAYVIINRYSKLEIGIIKNPKEDLELSKLGGTLSNESLLNAAKILEEAKKAERFRDRIDYESLELDLYFKGLDDEKELREEIRDKIIDEENVADNASRELLRIKKELGRKRQNLRSTLSKEVSERYKDYLSQNVVTMRNGRFVIPVKSEFKREVKGLAHDISSSGNTIFIEPEPFVQTNNDIKILEAREKEEIKKILLQLSNKVKEKLSTIAKDYQALINLDMYFAKGQYAVKTNSISPKLSDKGEINLKEARHPLLDSEKVTPIDLELKRDKRILIITGPNTGGKTVALKIVGLFELMVCCGLMILAKEGSEVFVPSRVLVNIGDEQSIENSLSTFSAEIKNMIYILDKADEKTLVLLDELCAGTDPEEGSALALAMIDYLKDKKSMVILTTHYPALKVYGVENKWAENGSFEFDAKTLKPTYKLILGFPGSSKALLISKEIGLQKEVLQSAQNYMTSQKMAFEKILLNLEQKRKELEKELEKQKSLAIELNKVKDEYKRLKHDGEEELKKQTQDLKDRLKYLLDQTREESNRLLNSFKEWEKEKKKEGAKDYIVKTKGVVDRAFDKISKVEDEILKEGDESPDFKGYKVGDSVLLKSLNQKGKVLKPPNKDDMVLINLGGGIKTRVKTKLLIPLKKQEPRQKTIVLKDLNRTNRKVNLEIDVRGRDKEEALEMVERFIDDCLIDGLSEAMIIHGMGTGVLKKAIRQRLKMHRNIEKFRRGKYGEGEDGVTIITLK